MILTRLSVLLVVLAPVSTGLASVFITPTTYPCGQLPIAAAVQDFNHDGFADIATVNGNARNVSVFLNNGDGTFAPANTFTVGGGDFDIASADLDDDGNFDLVVSDKFTSLYIVFGQGDGTFGPASIIQVNRRGNFETRGIAIADLNSDGIPDLGIAIYNGTYDDEGKIAILIGEGDGSFAPPVFYPLNDNPERLVATDLDKDGVLDLAVAVHFFNNGPGLAVLLGNGDGTFQPAVLSVNQGFSSDVAAGDFNGDGNIDLALASDANNILVVLGNGDGTFQPATTYPGFGRVKATDMNGDGILDLVSDGGPAILFGDGAGGFGPPTFYSAGSGFTEVGDFNSDRTPDIVTGNYDAIAVAFGRGHGALRAPTKYLFGGEAFDSADFDGDGNADLVTSTVGSGKGLSFVPGLGDGTFAEAISFSDLNAEDLIAADLNGDHQSDILFTRSSNRVYTMLGTGDGTFQSAQTSAADGTELSSPVIGDFNHDRLPDVALTNVGDDKLEILLGNGDGTFQPALKMQTGDTPQSPSVADFNADGNLDVVVSNTLGGTIGVYLGHGDGTFDAAITTPLANAIYSAAADLNKDAKADVVVAGIGLQVLLGNGDGTFGSPANVYAKDGPVRIADVDRDGRPDIVVSGNFDVLAVLRGQGDGTFRPAVEFSTGGSVFPFVLKDLNHDRLPEAILGEGNTLTVLFNTSFRE